MGVVGVVRDFVIGRLVGFSVSEVEGFNCKWSFVVSSVRVGCGFSFRGDFVTVDRWGIRVDGIYSEVLCVGDPLFFVKLGVFLDVVVFLDGSGV